MASNSHNDPLADDDPTNELPVLDPGSAIADNVPAPENPKLTGSQSLTQPESQTDQRIADLQADLARRDIQLEALQMELAGYNERQAHMDAGLQHRDDQIAALKDQLSLSESQLAEQKTELARMADDIRVREAEFSAVPDQGPDASLEAELAGAREKIGTLEHYISNRSEHWQALDAALATEQTRVAELAAELEQRERRTAQAQAREKRAESQAAALRQRLVIETDAARARENALVEAGSRSEVVASQIVEAETRNATLEAEIGQWRALSETLRSESAAQAKQVQERNQAAEREARRAAKIEKQLADRDKRIEKLESDLNDSREEHGTLQEQIQQFEKALQEARNEQDTIDESRDARIHELETSLASLEQSERDGDSVAERLTIMTSQHEELAHKTVALSEDLTARDAVVAHLESQVEHFRLSETGQKEALAANEARITELAAKLEERENELATTGGMLDTAMGDLQQAQEATAASSLQHADHLERIAHLEEQLETRMELTEELTRDPEYTQPDTTDAKSTEEADDTSNEDAIEQRKLVEELRLEQGQLAEQITASETRRQEQDILIGELRRQLREKDQHLNRTHAGDTDSRNQDVHQLNVGEPRPFPTARSAERAPTRLLICVSGDQEVCYPLYKDVLTIGRTGENDIQIRTHYVSRHHARIVSRRGEAFVEDLNSKNGVYVNSLLVTNKPLQSGDRLTIGETEFRYLVAPAQAT